MPNFLVKIGASIDTIPKANKGKVVSNPNNRLLSPVDCLMSSTNGPRLANAGRKFTAISRIPASSK